MAGSAPRTLRLMSEVELRRTPSTSSSSTVYVRDMVLVESSVLVNVISVSMGFTVQIPGEVSVTPVIVMPVVASLPVPANRSVALS